MKKLTLEQSQKIQGGMLSTGPWWFWWTFTFSSADDFSTGTGSC